MGWAPSVFFCGMISFDEIYTKYYTTILHMDLIFVGEFARPHHTTNNDEAETEPPDDKNK